MSHFSCPITQGKIVVLTGAGISAESGLSTFRGFGGLWENYRLEDVATLEAFQRNPTLVQNFYNERRKNFLSPSISPNPAHQALSALGKFWEEEFTIITQNIDNLHEKAGSKNVIHMHGQLLEVRCLRSGKIFRCESDILPETLCECCKKTGTLRPNVVWFGELPMFLDQIYSLLSDCSLFVSIGTSGSVYPAAGFVEYVQQFGKAYTIELNLEKTETSEFFHEKHYGPASSLVPMFFQHLQKIQNDPSHS